MVKSNTVKTHEHGDQSSTLFGDQAADWICPLCHFTPSHPLIACPECGCHILLTVKVRRLHDSLLLEGRKDEADALLRSLESK